MIHSTEAIIALIIFSLSLLTSCVSDNQDVEQPAYGDFECWDGICPGSTTFDEAVALLEAKHGKQNVRPEVNHISWTPTVDDRFRHGDIFIKQGIVNHVLLFVEHMAVKELIAQLGPPSVVHVMMAWSSEYHPCAGFFIHFRSTGVLASVDATYGPGVMPEQPVYSIMLLPPELAKSWSMTDTVIVGWQGYTDYCRLAFPYRFEDSG